ncbi:class I SAM-dependent methyltransferase [Tautonia plasticadhaerens]|uniref:Ubiquinone/menaquinone biosynthesis C-methyltransferase UbiE n=1 Tax=Tautonia plasticadhaerens TaxID=2527974 RepID=A0A518H204_9BACT|nr:methyltransferase domain-containing protein [Tautonia plasticadhaerens]QDV34854.1 Ubiquinone/menaquinone biosynthesis C-methyltransferase UbiE [Tautonia plasticadhaerens]
MSRLAIIALLGLAPILPSSSSPVAAAPREPVATGSSAGARVQEHDHDHDRPATDGTYRGRIIADVMSYLGANWLMRPSRIREERPDEMLDALGIEPGMAVADVGAGVGYHSLKMAERVGPEGVVYATDVQPEMLRMLRRRAQQAGAANVRPVLVTQDDPGLPEGQLDLILMVDVYHEVTDPEATLRGLREALKPGGRLVLVEFRAEDPAVPIKPEHKMSVAQARAEVEPQGLPFKEVLDFLPWQHVIIFEKPADPADAEADADADADAEPPGEGPAG